MTLYDELRYELPSMSLIGAWANRVINSESQYSEITQLFAYLYKQLDDSNNSAYIPYPSSGRYDFKEILYSLVIGDYSKLKTQISKLKNEFYTLIETSHFRSIDKLVYLIREGLFFEIVLREQNVATPTIFTKDLVNRILDTLKIWNIEKCHGILSLFKLTFITPNPETYGDINFDGFNEIELAIISYIFLKRYNDLNDNVALYNHYKSIKILVDKLKESPGIVLTPSEETLRVMFKVSILLKLMGYSDSLALPNEERIKYINYILTMPSLRAIFKDKLEDAMKIGFELSEIEFLKLKLEKPIQIRIPLYVAIVIFMLLSSIPTFVTESILNIPLSWKFYVFEYTIGTILIYKAFKLPKDFIKTLMEERP